MAAAAITQTGARFPGIAALFEKSSISSSNSVDASRKKDAVANMFLSNAATRSPPGDLTKALVEKHLGGSSKTLRLQDFKLLRILGTGTFARVWLVKLAHPMQGAEDRVFALKVLRKTEGERRFLCGVSRRTTLTLCNSNQAQASRSCQPRTCHPS